MARCPANARLFYPNLRFADEKIARFHDHHCHLRAGHEDSEVPHISRVNGVNSSLGVVWWDSEADGYVPPDLHDHCYVPAGDVLYCICRACEGRVLECLVCGGTDIETAYSGTHRCNDCGNNFREEDRPNVKVVRALDELDQLEDDLDAPV